jgi:RNase P subunit RPR2
MPSTPKPPTAIVTTSAQLPRRCPACWMAVPTRTSESGGVTRLTCGACGWSERYIVRDVA